MARPAPAETGFARLPYPQWRRGLRWRQGEHVALIGPTGCGKTTVEVDLLKDRSYVTVLATKIKDPSLNAFLAGGYQRIRDFEHSPLNRHKFILWPETKGGIRSLKGIQHARFLDALNTMFRQGGWTVAADELHYLCHSLGLQPEMETYFHQGRSSNLTVIYGTQRPAWIPVVAYSAITHALVWKTGEPGDAKRLAGMARTDPETMRRAMNSLGPHEFIAIDTRAEGAEPIITEYRK